MTYANDNRIGAEDLQWQVFQVIYSKLNAAIAAEGVRGDDIDTAFNALTGRQLDGVTVDQIDPDNFHMGHRPSLIESPVSNWPAIAVMAYSSVQSPIDFDLDQAMTSRVSVSIEFITAAGPYKVGADGQIVVSPRDDAEETVDRKLKRAAEAIQVVMLANRELGGYHRPSDQAPTITFGEVFIRDGAGDGTDREGRYFWQGVRFQYTYDKTTWF